MVFILCFGTFALPFMVHHPHHDNYIFHSKLAGAFANLAPLVSLKTIPEENGSLIENTSPKKHKSKQSLSKEDQQAIREIAGKLGETQKSALSQVSKIARICGMEFIQQTFDKTFEVEAQGGLVVGDSSRRRTTGGVFFKLARDTMSDEQHKYAFGSARGSSPFKRQRQRDFVWVRRLNSIQKIKKIGAIVDMRVKLMGYPGDVVRVHDAMMTQMQYQGSVESIPNGLPKMPQTTMTYTVYISPSQWKKVEKKLENPDLWLVIDGLLAPDPETDSFSVFATGVSTAKAKKPVAATQPKAQETQKTPQPVKTKSAPEKTKPPALPTVPPVPLDSPEAQQKLQELHVAADKYRAKIAEIEAQPEDQRFGLQMTQKLLTGIETQIQALTPNDA
jgi:hypothetical protein